MLRESLPRGHPSDSPAGNPRFPGSFLSNPFPQSQIPMSLRIGTGEEPVLSWIPIPHLEAKPKHEDGGRAGFFLRSWRRRSRIHIGRALKPRLLSFTVVYTSSSFEGLRTSGYIPYRLSS